MNRDNYIAQVQDLIYSLRLAGQAGYKVFTYNIPVGGSVKDEIPYSNYFHWRTYSHTKFTLKLNDGDGLDMSLVTPPEDVENFPIFKWEVINNDPANALAIIFVVAVQVPTVYIVNDKDQESNSMRAEGRPQSVASFTDR